MTSFSSSHPGSSTDDSVPGNAATSAKSAHGVTPPVTAEEEELALKLWVVLARANGSASLHAEDDVTRRGIGLAEFAALEALYHKGPLLLGEIQRSILISSGGITYVIDRLEKKGYVKREACPSDRRATYATLTPEGRALMAEIFPMHRRRIALALRGLSASDKQHAIDLLRRLGKYAAELDLSIGDE